MISHATPINRDARYEHAAQRTFLPITVHRRDGTTEDTKLILDPSQMELFSIQLTQALEARDKARL